MKGMVIYAHHLYRRGHVVRFEVHDFYDDPLFLRLSEVVGGHIEVVRPVGLPDPLLMIVNEEGLLRGLDLNTIASILYGIQHHGQPIVGNAVIMKEGFVDGEPDIVGLDPEDINALNHILKACALFIPEIEEDDDDSE